MGVTIAMTPRQLAAVLKSQEKSLPRAVTKGLRAGAMRGLAHMPGKTPTDQGQLRNGWRASASDRDARGRFLSTGGVPRLYNDAPHAGIVESGARPHPVSEEGMDELRLWAMRKLGVDEKEGKRIAEAIAWKLRTDGQEPTYFTRAEIPALLQFAEQELDRELKKVINNPPKGTNR
jgi:hypothetical protein